MSSLFTPHVPGAFARNLLRRTGDDAYAAALRDDVAYAVTQLEEAVHNHEFESIYPVWTQDDYDDPAMVDELNAQRQADHIRFIEGCLDVLIVYTGHLAHYTDEAAYAIDSEWAHQQVYQPTLADTLLAPFLDIPAPASDLVAFLAKNAAAALDQYTHPLARLETLLNSPTLASPSPDWTEVSWTMDQVGYALEYLQRQWEQLDRTPHEPGILYRVLMDGTLPFMNTQAGLARAIYDVNYSLDVIASRCRTDAKGVDYRPDIGPQVKEWLEGNLSDDINWAFTALRSHWEHYDGYAQAFIDEISKHDTQTKGGPQDVSEPLGTFLDNLIALCEQHDDLHPLDKTSQTDTYHTDRTEHDTASPDAQPNDKPGGADEIEPQYTLDDYLHDCAEFDDYYGQWDDNTVNPPPDTNNAPGVVINPDPVPQDAISRAITQKLGQGPWVPFTGSILFRPDGENN